MTFDTGGISIKPAQGMEEMKWDMGGAGAVVGRDEGAGLRKAKANVVGVCGLVENMPDGNAQRPGDVVTTMSGQTVEVINTDAEGRLVLCDAMTWAQQNFKPKVIVDLATLTGAMVISARPRICRHVRQRRRRSPRNLIKAGRRERRQACGGMPLGEAYDRLIDSPIADMKNVGPREARLDHRGAVPPALRRRRRRLGAPRHRRHGLVGQGRRDLRQGRDRLRRAPARPISSPTRSRADRRRPMRVDFYQLGDAPAESVIAAIAGKLLGEGQRLLVVADDEALLARLDRHAVGPGRGQLPPARARRRQPTTRASRSCCRPGTDAPNLARNMLIADGEWREAALGYRPRLLSVRRATRSRRARLAWKLLAGRDGVERHYWAQRGRAAGSRRPEPCPCRALAARGAANPNPLTFMELPMAVTRTFSIIKPDATRRNLTGAVTKMLEEAGLRVVASKRIHMTRDQAEGFYAVHSERPFFNDLCTFMTSGPVVVQVLEGEDAVKRNRDVMGATNPADAAEGTIRKTYAESIEANSVHGSDSDENAAIEIAFFFKPEEIVG